MADIQAFSGLRPRAELAKQVACPPYDVLSEQEARDLARGNPVSFLRVIRPEIDLDSDVAPEPEAIYQKGRENLDALIEEGVLQSDDSACLYIYRLTRGERVQHGVVAGVSVDEYEQGLIKKHEWTRPAKVEDRTRHTEVIGANAGPVLLTYRSRAEISRLAAAVCQDSDPVCDFVAEDGVGHTLWRISEVETITKMQAAFASVEALYIADGHHRAEAARRVRERARQGVSGFDPVASADHFLAVAFPDDELNILAYHRVVRDLGGMDPEAFLQRIRQRFQVSQARKPEPERPGQFGMYLEGSWYRLESDRPEDMLDATVLQERLLGPVLGITDPRSDPRIDFVGGSRGMRELEKRCAEDMRVAFSLFPVGVDVLLEVADRGEQMPPKSTWFEPKLRSGLVVRCLDRRKS